MNIIKRNDSEAVFDLNKIIVAVSKANQACEKKELSQGQINDIAEYVEFKIGKANRALSVEEIQDIVEDQIMAQGAFEVAKRYVKYRYTRSLVRKANTTDNQILSLIECNNEEVKQENSNKNPTVNSVQRDYMAAHQSTIAKIKSLVKNLPEFCHIAAACACDINKVNGNNALIESAVELMTAIFIADIVFHCKE